MDITTKGTEDIFEFPPDFLEKEAYKMIGKIKEDGLNGIFQNGRGLMSYRSKQYAKYKANGMNRLTHGGDLRETTVLRSKDGNYKGTLENRLYGSRKRKFEHIRVGKGQSVKTQKRQVYGDRLKAFVGVSTNRDISKVNMFLTGKTYKGMRGKALQNGFEISFAPEDAGKIEGNQRWGYDIVGLNEENRRIVEEDFNKFLKEQVGIKANIDITIKI